MSRIVLQVVGAALVVALTSGVDTLAAEAEQAHSFEFTLASRIDMDVAGRKRRLDSNSVLRYTWRRRGNERALNFDSLRVESTTDGKTLRNEFMDRSGTTNTEKGETRTVPFDRAPEEVKRMLRDSFMRPLCQARVDEDGKELERKVVAGPGAKDLVDQGTVTNAFLFHPLFPRARDEWTVTTEISMGNGGFARGQLTYKKVGKGGQVVKVSGTLTNPSFSPPGSRVTFQKTKYVVNGEQTYDGGQREWASGRLLIDVSFEVTVGDVPLGPARGTMKLDFVKLPGKK